MHLNDHQSAVFINAMNPHRSERDLVQVQAHRDERREFYRVCELF